MDLIWSALQALHPILRHPDACKPCAWFWHHKGCQSGVDCEFCHLCPRGELKARQQRQRELKTVPRDLNDRGIEETLHSFVQGCQYENTMKISRSNAGKTPPKWMPSYP